MHSTSTTKADRFTAIAKVTGTCITISIWCFVGVWIYRQVTNFGENSNPQTQSVEPIPQKVEEIEDKIETVPSSTEIEQFRPQLNTSTWGEVEEIINSFKSEMKQCESYDGENKIACYDHYKTQFWRKMNTEVEGKK